MMKLADTEEEMNDTRMRTNFLKVLGIWKEHDT